MDYVAEIHQFSQDFFSDYPAIKFSNELKSFFSTDAASSGFLKEIYANSEHLPRFFDICSLNSEYLFLGMSLAFSCCTNAFSREVTFLKFEYLCSK